MSQVYCYDFTVSANALDENGHVNNVEYVRWLQEAAIRHAERQGCTPVTRAIGATWVVRTHEIEYFRPAFAGEHICVLTWVSNFRRVQSLRKYKIVRLDDKALLAEGETDWVFVDAQTGKIRSIPADIQTAFEILPIEQESAVISRVIESLEKPI